MPWFRWAHLRCEAQSLRTLKELLETLGGDMFEGSWAKNLLKPIDYSGSIKDIDAGSFSGYLNA